MIVNSFDEMRRFLPAVNVKVSPRVIEDSIEVAQDSLCEQILGDDLTEQLSSQSKDDKQLLVLCQRAISLEAFLRVIPRLDLVLTEAGFGVISNEGLAPASKDRIESLTASLRQELDEAKDRIVSFLIKSSKYVDWRGTEVFSQLTDGLFLTFADFKEFAVFNPRTAEMYPKTWDEFRRLGASLNVALTADAASYISPEYAEELLEKVRDTEPMVPNERKVLRIIKTAVAAIALGDKETGINEAIKAAAFMRSCPPDFPTFIASGAASDLSTEHTDSPIFFMI